MFGSLGAETIMKKLDVIEVYSRNNEIHFVLQEHKNNRRRRKRTGACNSSYNDFMYNING